MRQVKEKELLLSHHAIAERCPEELHLGLTVVVCQLVKGHISYCYWGNGAVKITWFKTAFADLLREELEKKADSPPAGC